MLRPAGTQIELRSSPTEFFLQTPARGVHRQALSALVGGALAILICAQWTRAKLAAAEPSAAAISLPGWLFGIAIVFRSASAMLRHHRIILRPEHGTITTLPIGIKRPLRTDEILVRFDEIIRGEADGRGGVEVPLLVLEDRRTSVHLLEGFSDDERRWVRAEVNKWLASHGRPPS